MRRSLTIDGVPATGLLPLIRRSLGSALALAACGGARAQQSAPPPPVSVLQSGGSLAPGYIFITPAKGGGASPSYSPGAEIVDNQGRPVWFQPVGGVASDLRVQAYQGNPVLTWSQGTIFENVAPGASTDYIADTSYHVIATVQAGDGFDADQHEFRLTPDGTALITAFDIVSGDLTPVGGPASGQILEGTVQEIDVATGQVLLDWHSTDHVPLSESHFPYGQGQTAPYDYFHVNSVNLDTDGNLLVSARHTWTVYKINRSTGAILWRLGGKSSDFALGTGLPFAWQHDAIAVDAATIRIFDNESDGTPVLPYSRALWVHHDDTAMTASIVRSIEHPDALSVNAEGCVQDLPNGDAFVEWGALGRFSEFDAGGALLYDAALPKGFGSYRGYRFAWTGNPTTSPSVSAAENADGSLAVHAVWNGATSVATWSVSAGNSSDSLAPVATAPWNGLDTLINVSTSGSQIQVVALDSSGAELGRSTVLSGPFAPPAPAITAQPESQTAAPGATVSFRAGASGSQSAYQWTFNGSPLSDGAWGTATVSGSTGPVLLLVGADQPNDGGYSCVVSNPGGTASTSPATLTTLATADTGRLVNVSCRALDSGGAAQLVVGFAVGGGDPSVAEPVLVRASGPALSAFGISNVLSDPALQVFSLAPGGSVVASDAGWAGSSAVAGAASAAGAFSWTDPSSADSALVQSLPPGPYTANITGLSGDSGVALAEVYDLTPPGTFNSSSPRLINVSARAAALGGTNTLIAGFVIGGSTSKTVLIRGSGPALAQFGVAGNLSDPQVQLFDATGKLLAVDDDWAGDPEISATAARVGAFAWTDPASSDCALIATLPPGAYTAAISGLGGSTGICLIEVYDVP